MTATRYNICLATAGWGVWHLFYAPSPLAREAWDMVAVHSWLHYSSYRHRMP